MTKPGDSIRFPRAGLRPKWGAGIVVGPLPASRPAESPQPANPSSPAAQKSEPAPEPPAAPSLDPEPVSAEPAAAHSPADSAPLPDPPSDADPPRRRKPKSSRRRTATRPRRHFGGLADDRPEYISFLNRHMARCQICRHPDRENLERDFINWHSAEDLALNYGLGSWRVVYRHAHAIGLIEYRRKNYEHVLDWVIDQVAEGNVKVSGTAVVAAVRLKTALAMKREAEAASSAHAEAPAIAEDDQDSSIGRVIDGNKIVGPNFILDLDGLPRTDAVTGRSPDEEES